MAKNLAKKPKGHIYVSTNSTDYTDLFEATLIGGGGGGVLKPVHTFLSDNLDGPDVDTAKRWFRKHSFKYDFHHVQKLLSLLLNFIREVRSRRGEAVPYLKAENETAIEARPSYDEQLDCVWVFCGLHENHECKDIYLIPVSNYDGAYERLVQNIENSKIAAHARLIMINPLHERVPRIVLHLQLLHPHHSFAPMVELRQFMLPDFRSYSWSRFR